VLPIGAYEQHGPHLPLATDTVLAGVLARRVADALGAFLLPALPFGESSSNDGFPGTVSLAFDTVRSVLRDVTAALERGGFACLIVVNGDYGNRAPLRQGAGEAARRGFPVLVIDYPGLEEAAQAVCETAPPGGIHHAEELETSIMLAVVPRAVRVEAIVAEQPLVPATFGAAPTPLHTLSSSGVFGDPRPATAAKGERLLDLLAASAVELARQFLAGLG